MRRRLFWRIFPLHLALVLAALGGAAWYVSGAVRELLIGRIGRELEARARVVQGEVEKLLAADRLEEIDPLCKEVGRRSGTRVTVIRADGTVLGDSEHDPRRMESHTDRPEVRQALARPGESGRAIRHSGTLQKEMMYVAVAVPRAERIAAVVRTALFLTEIETWLREAYQKIALGALIAAGAATVATLLVSRSISRPLEEMRRGAERFAAGDLKVRFSPTSCDELAALSNALNHAAAQLDERIEAIVRSRNEREAISLSMAEGILALDMNSRVMSVNHSACRMLGIEAEGAVGRTIEEVIRNAELHALVTAALSASQLVEGDVVFRGRGERFLHARGTPYVDAAGKRIGAVVVLNDVTRVRRLERARRDFVANVSHELKTPITSIKGFVETLADGAIENREEAERFLGIIARHADRLASILDDLLALSRIEQDVECSDIALERVQIAAVLSSAVNSCEPKRADKGVSVETNCPAELEVDGIPQLLEQAVVNLLDNAIKHSPSGSTVRLEGRAQDREAVISVSDHGPGIAAEHLPRLFERFYRVDKGRSREQGGTGLGLAIVKHIAQAHRGSVEVRSEPGKGSTFTIRLPLRKAAAPGASHPETR